LFQTTIPTLPSIIKQKDVEDKPNILKKLSTNPLNVSNIVSALCCDKCDGEHQTSVCPHYKKTRDVHIDAQKNGWKLLGLSSNLPGD
jgi:hypothetical protein